jgi:hypothetical protein
MKKFAALIFFASALAVAPACAADIFANQPPTASTVSPAVNGAAITPNDSTPLTQPTRMIYVGGAGDLTVILVGDTAAITFKAVPVGTVLNVRASTVKATGTTATNLVALW